MVTRAQYTRSARWRNTDYSRRNVVDRVGFPVNGVYRGGYYSATYGHATLCRSAYRNVGNVLSYEWVSIGFRCEWCNKRCRTV